MVVGGLIAAALIKAHVSRNFPPRKKSSILSAPEPPKDIPAPEIKTEAVTHTPVPPPPQSSPENPTKPAVTHFHSHSRKMESFRKAHGK
jgi:hypothetical protein